ncbi:MULTISPECIES: DEAD/DEAH box helicase [Streptomyces]|uniref:RNA helicase n=2 Tax=Streptomyces TaxID=1883 RepID=A0ABU4K6D7_9ACTN|nr:DEAD/DEAH box helicase [Streptomyces roseolus]MDX2293311.1 DEAD/DEAH box helicase [Streptomyces roseolus]
MTLPVALTGTDVIGQAKTGTGKTLGFGLPILERVTVPADVEAGRAKPEQLTEAPQALVVVPTRELCQQVTNDLLTAGKVRNVRVLAIYGGRAYEPQVEALQKGVDVVVGTPGRLLDLAGQRKLDLSHVKTLVLDEADEMLDLGFLPDVEKIINMLPATRQTMLFSATMPGAVIGLARRYMSRPTHIRATSPDNEGATHANITQHVYRAHNMDKPEMVARILQARGRGLAMIFCRTKRTAADIAEQLQRRGFASGAVHGDLGQGAREQALRAFRNGKVDVLVCTDVAARGIDVDGVTHVINYQTPEDEKTYLHRTGRTGRAGNTGTAITLVDWDDIPRWQLINKALELDFADPVETYSSSPHLYTDLDIPEGTKGILPRSERTRAGLDAEELEDLGEPGGRRGRGGRAEAPAAEERPARTRTPRQRRRTRGGADAEAPQATAAPETAESPEAVDGPRRPRRRRTRGTGPVGGGIPVAGATPVTPAPAEEPAQAAAPAEAPAAPAEESAPRRRRRGGRTETETAVVETVEAPVAEAPAAPAEAPAAPAEESAPRRRRRGGRTETVAAAPVAPAAAPAPAFAPRKRRVRPRAEETVTFQTVESAAAELAAARKQSAPVPAQSAEQRPVRTAPAQAAPVQAAPAEAPAAAVPAQAVAAPPRGRRRVTRPATTSAPVVEAAAPVVVEAPAAPVVEESAPRPRRRAVRKASSPVTATAAAEAVVVIPAPVAEAPVEEAPKAPRKRTAAKKTAAAVTEAPATEEAPKAPRKRTTAKKTAEATTEAPATEEAPKAPRKRAATKKTAAAVAPDASEPQKATTTRRRTVKKAAEAPAEEAPKAPRKRVAKKAAPAQPEA